MCFPEHLLRIGGPHLDDPTSQDFQDTCQGFVEFGFSSATPNKRVALEYSGAMSCDGPACKAWNASAGFCETHRSTLLEISTSQIDRGASLMWVSQFPAEDEHTLLPLCNFEIVGMRREIFCAADGKHGKQYSLNILEIKLNLNLNALTLEQLRESRKTTVTILIPPLL